MKILSLCSVLIGAAPGQSLPVELRFTSSTAIITGTNLANGSSDTVQYSLTGSLLARIGIDRESGKLTDFRMTGGRLFITDFDATGTFFFTPTTVEARGLASTPGTSDVETTIDPETGMLAPGVHFYDQNEGSLIFRNAKGDVFYRRDYSESPLFRFFGDTMTATGELAGSNLLGKRYRILFTQDRVIDEEFGVSGNTTIHLAGTSLSVAEGETTVVSEMARQWADDSDNVDFVTIDASHSVSGLPLAVLFALGKGADAGLGFFLNRESRSCSLSLPESGSRLPIFIEWSETLEPDSWETIPSGGTIEAGTSGSVSIGVPDVGCLFVRLRAEVP